MVTTILWILGILIGIPIALVVLWNVIKLIAVIVLDIGNLIFALVAFTVVAIIVSALI